MRAAYDYTRDIETWTAALQTAYARATSDQIHAGMRWYSDASTALQEYTGDIWSPAQAYAVCAVLSPRVTWKENVTGVRRMHKAAREHLRVCPTVAGTRRNVERAWVIAQTGDVSLVSGPKVRSFYANISGDYSRVTVDVWAARATGISDAHMTHLDRRRYVAIETAYQRAAAISGHAPAQFQAIVWGVVRGKHE